MFQAICRGRRCNGLVRRGSSHDRHFLIRQGHRLGFQGHFQYLVDPAHRHDLKSTLHVVRNLGQIFDVLFGDQHRLDAAAQSRQQLFLEATNGGNLTAQRDLTGHGNITAPALGPSLGVAPSGTWMWMARFSNASSLMPRMRERLRTTVRAASTDSFITSPKEPVRVITPLPGMAAASLVSRSPPTSVQARPTTWPTWFCASARP